MKNEKWYTRRLAAYCEEKYGKFEDEIEFCPNPSIRQWMFYIPSLRLKVILSCSDDGVVTEIDFSAKLD